ncbi:transposase [Micromonospora sp. WMMD737]|uniref:transposase n=1 Tax=Micromonospora sp. WMMD737 TaxID=3404113 RepID=UPI003B92EC35
MAGTRRRFDPEVRAGAVEIVRETGKSIAQVARDLGINSTLTDWVQPDRPVRLTGRSHRWESPCADCGTAQRVAFACDRG